MNEIATSLVVGLLILAVAGLIGFQIWKASLAKLTLAFEPRLYQPGETLDVTLHLKARRALSWEKMTLSLVCRHRNAGDGTAQNNTIFEQVYDLSGPDTLPAGLSKSFHQKIYLPTQAETGAVDLPLPESLEKPLAALAELGARDLDRNIHWRLNVHVDSAPVLGVSHRLEFALKP